jgi:ribosome-associated protein
LAARKKPAATADAPDADPAAEASLIEDTDAADDELPISKSEAKRRMLALQAVGEELVRLPVETLRRFDLPERLFDAIVDAKRINPNKHGGVYRQMQYIGKLMRLVDAAPIVEKLDALKAPSRRDTAMHHLAEQWRTRILSDASALNAFRAEFMPDADDSEFESLQTMVGKAREEYLKHQPPKFFRQTYKLLLKYITAHAS